MSRWKCYTCFLICDEEDLIEGRCPSCGEKHIIKMCNDDHLCNCTYDVTPGISYCKTCGEPVCPCGSHDVEVITRVTGYLQTLKGFNSAKAQEVRDRQRYDAISGMQTAK